MSLAQTYARHALAPIALSPERNQWIRALLYDYLAVTLGGTERESAQSAREAYAPLSLSESPASVVGGSFRLSAEDAALVNGITAHGLELDDTFEEASLHPGVVIFPALLAVAEEHGAELGALLDAATVGYDIMCHVGVVLGAAECYGRGFHPTGVAGVIGASAAVARLRGLTEEQTANAIGVAATMAAGSLEFLSDGSWTKRLNAGHAAAVGVRAVRLAGAGFIAPQAALEGRDGFLYNFGEGFIPDRVAPLEAGAYAWRTSIKLYPCCRYMHGNLDLLLDIATERPCLTSDDIHDVEIAVIEAGARLVSQPAEAKFQVESAVDAQFNMFFAAALALTTGTATVDQFDHAAELAPGLLPLMRKVRCVTSPTVETTFPTAWTAEARVTLVDGTVLTSNTKAFRGSPGARATRDDLVAKATGLIGADRAERLLDVFERPRTDSARLLRDHHMNPVGLHQTLTT
ncbi:MmgE/PrpD family protein [Rhodococcus sp. NPDC057529]|uniref:MmgE/PrpD family protein n=1 Tax=Rhodococcus sp. NPDC057529 TaxID=3346158 RepID=UPI0036705E6F